MRRSWTGGAFIVAIGLFSAAAPPILTACKTNSISATDNNDFVSQTIDKNGGRLTLPDGSTVFIPAGALDAPTVIRFGRVSAGYPVSPSAIEGFAYSVEPHTQTFMGSINVALLGSGSVETAQDMGAWAPIPTAPTTIPEKPGQPFSQGQAGQGGYFAVTGGGDGGVGTDPGKDGGPTSGDGKIVASGLNLSGSGGGQFAMDDTYAYYVDQTTDGLGVMTNTLLAVPLNSPAMPTSVATLQQAMPGGKKTLAAANGYVYWVDGPQGGAQSLMRAQPGSAPTTVSPLGMFGSSLVVAATHLLFVDGSNHLRRFDTQAGTLDATSYGTLGMGGMGSFVTATATSLFWLVGGGTQPFVVWSAAVGSPGAATTASFPGAAMLSSFGAMGTTVAVTAGSGQMMNVVTLDTATPGAPTHTIAMVAAPSTPPGAGGSSSVVYQGNYVFIATFSNMNTSADPIVRVSLADGTQTTVGNYVAAGGQRPIAVTATSVYVLQPSRTTGVDVAQWPLPL